MQSQVGGLLAGILGFTCATASFPWMHGTPGRFFSSGDRGGRRNVLPSGFPAFSPFIRHQYSQISLAFARAQSAVEELELIEAPSPAPSPPLLSVKRFLLPEEGEKGEIITGTPGEKRRGS
jgi:hypothetical protein